LICDSRFHLFNSIDLTLSLLFRWQAGAPNQEEAQEEQQEEQQAPPPMLPFTVLINKGDKVPSICGNSFVHQPS
jgi:hypothetical protein